MTQIIPTDFDIAAEESAEFVPMRGVANPHLQTMLPRLIRRKVQFNPHWQRIDLPDGDFLDLAWSEDPDRARLKPRLVVFHGLEGSLHSPYAHGLIEAAKARGWLGVVLHFRGLRIHNVFLWWYGSKLHARKCTWPCRYHLGNAYSRRNVYIQHDHCKNIYDQLHSR